MSEAPGRMVHGARCRPATISLDCENIRELSDLLYPHFFHQDTDELILFILPATPIKLLKVLT